MTTKEKLDRMIVALLDFVGAPDTPRNRYELLVPLQATYLVPGRITDAASINQLATINEAILEVNPKLRK